DKGFYDFFATGKYNVHVVGLVKVQLTNSSAPLSLDFIGLNHYSNRFHCLGHVKEEDPELQTENPNYRFYPEGLERAAHAIYTELIVPHAKRTGKTLPLFIAENGIATKNDVAGNEKRTKF